VKADFNQGPVGSKGFSRFDSYQVVIRGADLMAQINERGS
jgi:hypothetical protein